MTLEQRLHSYEPIFGNWMLQGEIGTGSYARVYKVVNCDPFGMIIDAALKAIEIIPDGNVSEENVKAIVREQYINEVNLMAAMRGISNVVSYEDHAVMEIRENGRIIGYDLLIRMEKVKSLDEMMRAGDRSIYTQSAVRKMGMDLCRGLERCHRIGILHRDIKVKNIFLNQFGDYKLGDFGVAHHLEGTMYARTRIGTDLYAAPEITDKTSEKYGAQADLYSLGLVLYQMANYGYLPFITADTPRTKYKDAIDLRNSGEPIPLPAGVDERLGEIIRKACAYEPSERYANAQEMYRELQRFGRASQKTEHLPAEVAETKPGLVARAWAQVGISVISTPDMQYMEERLRSYVPQNEDKPKEQTPQTARVLLPEQAEKLPLWRPKVPGFATNDLVLDSYEEIGAWAFKGRKDLAAVSVRDTVRVIGEEAFAECAGLSSLELDSPLEEIGPAAFRRCTKLETVQLPISVHRLGERIFQDCTALEAVYVSDEVTEIPPQAFSGCRALHQVRIAAGVREIGADAFRGCGSIQRFAIPERVAHIGTGAFSDCRNMQEVRLSSELRTVPKGCFSGCTALTAVFFADGLETIEAQAFRQCSGLTELEIPYGVQKIGAGAFAQCENLTFLRVPETVTSIGDGAFGDGGSRLIRGLFSKLTVYTPRGSYAWNYCRQNGIRTESDEIRE